MIERMLFFLAGFLNFNMGDPLVAPALVGFGVDLLLTEVIKAGRIGLQVQS